MKREYVTIATDISRKTEKGVNVATWAAYIRGDFGTVQRCGEFREFNSSTWWLEAKAMANALHIANKNCDLRDVNLVIYSEIESLVNPKQPGIWKISMKTPAGRLRWQFINEYLLPYLLRAKSFDIRKVDAHTNKHKEADAPKMYYMNEWCDQACKALRKEIMARKLREIK